MGRFRDAALAAFFPTEEAQQGGMEAQRGRELDSFAKTHEHYRQVLADGNIEDMPAADAFLGKLLIKYTETIRSFVNLLIEEHLGKVGKQPRIMFPLVELAPEKLALITLRHVMSNLANGSSVVSTAEHIASDIKDEKEFENWYDDASEDNTARYFWVRYPNPGRRAVDEWLKLQRKKKGNAFVPKWSWDNATKVMLGSTLIELLVITHPDVFETIITNESTYGKARSLKILVMKEEALRWFLAQGDYIAMLQERNEPLLFVPEDWSIDFSERKKDDDGEATDDYED